MITLLRRTTRGTLRRPSPPAPPRGVERVDAAVTVRRILAGAIQAEWITRNEGLAIMRWLERLEAPSSRRKQPRLVVPTEAVL